MDPTVPEKKKDGKLWFHLACPTRIAKHKDGVCEASSFDDLNDDLYIKSVKPAHSAFGVVSYDKETDSTLLVSMKVVNYLVKILLQKNLSNTVLRSFFHRRFADRILVEHTNFVYTYNI